MEQGAKPISRKRHHHLRVPVFPEEEVIIKTQARAAGMSIACYLRQVGQGYQIKGVVDCEQVRELARINGDLGRLGGLLKLWLSNDAQTAQIGASTLRAVLSKIEVTQDKMADVMITIVAPKAEK